MSGPVGGCRHEERESIMTVFRKVLFVVLLVLLAACQEHATDNQRRTSQLYEGMFHGEQADIARLNQFFTRMPKGGDLHHHYTGSIYAETYLDWVAKKGWWINPCTLRIVTTREEGSCASLTVPQLMANNVLYRKLLTLWSDKDYGNHFHDQMPPDSNFFNTFGYFGTVSNEYMREGLEIIKQRALKENVSYIETMLARVPVSGKDYFSAGDAEWLNNALRTSQSPEELGKMLDHIVAVLDGNGKFIAGVDDYVSMIAANHQGMDDDNFTMRFQAYASRGDSPLQVFIHLYSGFLAANKSPLIVGVNIVAPENGAVALSDYTLHMRMFDYLHKKYPEVHRSLHAGELTLGMVRPDDLTFHIREALEIGHAQRIGHGVDLSYEQNSAGLLDELKKTGTAIEINLTSNQFILGVEGREHPYRLYSAYGIPIVISTDDSGVSRNNLSHEYMLLASRYHPSYEKMKEYAYNSIKYSFLASSDKAAARKALDSKFEEFEKEMVGLSGRLRL